MFPFTSELTAELRTQAQTYVDAGYPRLAKMSADAFFGLADAAIHRATSSPASAAAAVGTPLLGTPIISGDFEPRLAALLVVTEEFCAPEERVPLLRLTGSENPGFVDKNHYSDAVQGLGPYRPLPGLEVPDGPLYVLFGIERGDEFRNVAPKDATPVLEERGRTPLSIDEGISLATVAPSFLAKNHCFMLAGSRRGDKRVPALWISDAAPKLGWCFDAVPHTWLGTASASARA